MTRLDSALLQRPCVSGLSGQGEEMVEEVQMAVPLHHLIVVGFAASLLPITPSTHRRTRFIKN